MDVLHRIKSLFENLKSILKNKSSTDWSHMLKRNIQELSTELVVLGKQDHDLFVRSLAMEGYLALLTAKMMPITHTEKHNILAMAFYKLKPFTMRPECLFVFLRVQNTLCYYLIQLDKIQECREILEAVEELYNEIGKNHEQKLLDPEDLFSAESITNVKQINPEKIDKLVTNNIQMQAFLYNKLNMTEKYALYSHTALRRQLEMRDGTPQEWALRAARLGNYFTYLNQMYNARHHLCAAYNILRICRDRCKLIPTEFVQQTADFEMRFLEVSHHWVRYGLNLFKLSKKKILNRHFDQTEAITTTDLWRTISLGDNQSHSSESKLDENLKDEGPEKNEKEDCAMDKYVFPSLDLKEMEEKIPVELVTDTESARKLFIFTHKWLMRAKRYYNFEMQTAQYASCALQLAELYEHLVFFEHSIENQYNIQRRRAEVLEHLNALLKATDNMPVQIDVIRELSQVQLEMMALNLQKLWHADSEMNILNVNNDSDSIMLPMGSASDKTLTMRMLQRPSKNLLLRKMEAASAVNGRLNRLSEHLTQHTPNSPSQLSLFKN